VSNGSSLNRGSTEIYNRLSDTFPFSALTLLVGRKEGSDILVLKLISVLVFILFSSQTFYFI